jgi:hypothetical protein
LRLGMGTDKGVPEIRPAILQSQAGRDALRQEKARESRSTVLGVARRDRQAVVKRLCALRRFLR